MGLEKKGLPNQEVKEKKGTPGQDDFFWDYTDEPHASRRKQILAKYPEIKKLYGPCPRTKWVVLLLVTIQMVTGVLVRDASWPVFLLAVYVISGTINHMLNLAVHELSHNLGFKKMIYNRIFGIFCNLVQGVPSSVLFKRYHMEHHRYQGEDQIDMDIPTVAEGNFFNSSFKKLLFVIFQVFFYALRPVLVSPKSTGPWEIGNAVVCIVFDALVWKYLGSSVVLYFLLGSWFGSGLHPVAGHFIAEHYVFIKGYETYSYYGILNIFAFNVGYHNEHHDFPFIPGSRLPMVRKIAPEFYDPLPKHDSWVRVIYDYITDPTITAFSRVKRVTLTPEEVAEVKSQ